MVRKGVGDGLTGGHVSRMGGHGVKRESPFTVMPMELCLVRASRLNMVYPGRVLKEWLL